MCMHLTRLSKSFSQRLIEMEREINNSTIIVKDFNTPFLVTDKSSREKISKDIVDPNSTVSEIDLLDM